MAASGQEVESVLAGESEPKAQLLDDTLDTKDHRMQNQPLVEDKASKKALKRHPKGPVNESICDETALIKSSISMIAVRALDLRWTQMHLVDCVELESVTFWPRDSKPLTAAKLFGHFGLSCDE